MAHHSIAALIALAAAAALALSDTLPVGNGSCIVNVGLTIRSANPSTPSAPLAVESRVLDRAASAPGDLTIGPRGLILYLQ